MNTSNIILIGMPGAGKSTIGSMLARKLGKTFLDTDQLIETVEKRTLQNIIDAEGYMALRKIEENILLQIKSTNHVIATGGSAAYSHSAMMHLKLDGSVVFLNTDIHTLKTRIHNFTTRGLAKRPDQSFEELFAERYSLYLKYADYKIDNSDMSPADSVESIMKWLEICASNG